MNLILDFLFHFGLLINLIILAILYKNSRGEFHQKVLFCIFILILLIQICTIGYKNKSALLFYSTCVFDNASIVFIGPLLLLYVKSIFLPSKRLLKNNKIHFIYPLIYLTFVSIPFSISMWYKEYIFDYIAIIDTDYIYLNIIYSLVYCGISLTILKKAEKIILQNYSNLEQVDIKWIKHLLIGAILVMGLDISTTLYEIFFGELEWNVLYITSTGVVILVGYLGYNGLTQSQILLPLFLLKKHHLIPNELDQSSVKKQKATTTSPYDNNEMLLLKNKLQELMEEQHPFLDPDLSLKSLANLLAIPERKMSTLLNQYMNTSFHDYINGYRVDEVKRKLSNPNNNTYTLLAIALDSGFSSKTSFNRTFNKMTNMSPSEYKKAIPMAVN